MSQTAGGPLDIESMLRLALAPVEPPAALRVRVETRLQELTDLAVEELDSWELSSMRDPRNWARPVVATAVGATAGTALVVLRVRQQHRKRQAASRNPLDLAQRTLKAASTEARRLVQR
ncbi:hypothetical protein BH20ACT17_BH20ACT17_18950 [soil metagenome]|jgi:hypothetical protein